MAKLIIIRGCPGSGKSTLAKSMLTGLGTSPLHFETDEFFISINGYNWDPAYLKEAHEWCRLNALKAMVNNPGLDVIVSNTFIRMWEMEPYLKLAKEFGRDIKVVNMKTRYNSVHGVPPAKVDEMAKAFYHLRPEMFPEYFAGLTMTREETDEHYTLNFTH